MEMDWHCNRVGGKVFLNLEYVSFARGQDIKLVHI